MIRDEPAFYAKIPPRLREQVVIAARAMCRHRDEDADHEACRCDVDGGTCVAFGLYGDHAFAVVDALDRLFLERIIAALPRNRA